MPSSDGGMASLGNVAQKKINYRFSALSSVTQRLSKSEEHYKAMALSRRTVDNNNVRDVMSFTTEKKLSSLISKYIA